MFKGQQYMAMCAQDTANIDSRRRGFLIPNGTMESSRNLLKPDKSPVKLDRRRVSNRNFPKGGVDLGWLTSV